MMPIYFFYAYTSDYGIVFLKKSLPNRKQNEMEIIVHHLFLSWCRLTITYILFLKNPVNPYSKIIV